MPSPNLPTLSLYVHIPWCVRKCPYCDFNSHSAPERLPEEDYVTSVLADLERDASLAQGRRIDSVFFGGGTPSLFSATAIGAILEGAEKLVGLEPEAEITLEANPGTFEQQRFADYRTAGVNRLSLGLQSLQDPQLKALGRIHDRQDAIAAVQAARSAGFDNFNLDLMHGLPDQGVAEALADLESALALGPAHLSWYQLTIEPNTVFYSRPPQLPDSDVLAEIEDRGVELLESNGYARYEISAYCRPGRESRHNSNYWEFGDYLGIGAGAHGKITDAATGEVWRSRKTRLPAHYLADRPLKNAWSPVAPSELPLEFMMNALRLIRGVPRDLYSERTGLNLAGIDDQLSSLRARDLLDADGTMLRTTPLGRRFLNEVLDVFMPDDGTR
ncbi:radical SAM family heme chaperone HemW [Gilvimarinus sp. F26214L]|uniref:radical SAM family heme chaperone HemW n=1 Tax=Gilvimarinus sp. DZF01 TaxID=3461371 RepID=UPI0040459C21